MTSGSTPISPPTLWNIFSNSRWLWNEGEGVRMPVLDDGWRRVDDGSVHVEEEAIEGHQLW